jgi:endonuclease/exonuclease/phosphatase family metal-dependent hydrolase
VVRVATFNLHAGVDGWGRPTQVLEHVVALDADVMILPELWRGEGGHDFYGELRDRLAMNGAFAPLATGQRVTTGVGGRTWQPMLAHFTGEHGLYFDEHRSLTKAQRTRRGDLGAVEHGQWGLGLLTRLAIEDIRVETLDRLPREKVRRAFIVARLNDRGRSFYVIAVHGAHLSHGSYRQYRRISKFVDSLDPSVPILLAGDFNCWRPLLRTLLPGWTSMVRARTWPARMPHSQIDHILTRGPWQSLGGFASDGGSDHRALVADVQLR